MSNQNLTYAISRIKSQKDYYDLLREDPTAEYGYLGPGKGKNHSNNLTSLPGSTLGKMSAIIIDTQWKGARLRFSAEIKDFVWTKGVGIHKVLVDQEKLALPMNKKCFTVTKGDFNHDGGDDFLFAVRDLGGFLIDGISVLSSPCLDEDGEIVECPIATGQQMPQHRYLGNSVYSHDKR